MDKLEKAIKDLNEIKSKIIPVLSRMYGSGFSSVFACEKVEEKLNNALELLKEKQPKDVRCVDCVSRTPAKDPDCCFCNNPKSPCYQREVRDSDLCQFAEGW